MASIVTSEDPKLDIPETYKDLIPKIQYSRIRFTFDKSKINTILINFIRRIVHEKQLNYFMDCGKNDIITDERAILNDFVIDTLNQIPIRQNFDKYSLCKLHIDFKNNNPFPVDVTSKDIIFVYNGKPLDIEKYFEGTFPIARISAFKYFKINNIKIIRPSSFDILDKRRYKNGQNHIILSKYVDGEKEHIMEFMNITNTPIGYISDEIKFIVNSAIDKLKNMNFEDTNDTIGILKKDSSVKIKFSNDSSYCALLNWYVLKECEKYKIICTCSRNLNESDSYIEIYNKKNGSEVVDYRILLQNAISKIENDVALIFSH